MQHEAKTKPYIQELIDRASTLTDQEIESAPNLMSWHRDALRELRQKQYDAEKQKQIDAVLESLLNPELSTNGDPPGQIALWLGLDTFIKTGKTAIEIKNGFPVWFPDSGGVWIDTVFCKSVPIELARLSKGQAITRSEYMLYLRARRQKMV